MTQCSAFFLRTLPILLLVSLALACTRGPNVSSEQLPLKRVVIYRNGVGYFERQGQVDTDSVKFKMRAPMVGDFLATLAIVERGGSSVRSASFPLEIDREPVPSEPDPRWKSMLKPWAAQPGPEPPDPDQLREVVLSLDGDEHDLAIGYVAETPVWRPSYRLVIRKDGGADLQAWGIVQNLSGEDWQGVNLVLVAGAPLAFESTLGDPVIPPRPIVTDSGEVISAVPRSVNSLREESEDEALSGEVAEAEEPEEESDLDDSEGRYWGGRGKMKDKKKMGSRPGARPPSASEAPRPVMSSRERRRRAIEQALAEGPSRPRNLGALAVVAVEAGSTRYAIPNPVTVPDKSATMVLLLSKSVPGEAVFLFAPDEGVADSAAHPFRVARFTNATRGLLERGPIAIFEQGSFLGQGMMEPLPPGAKTTVPFALERSLAVKSEKKYDVLGARVQKIESGTLWIERDSVTKTIYTIKNGGSQTAKVLVRHARSPGTRLHEPPPGTEENLGPENVLAPISVASHRRAKMVIDERRPLQRRVDWLSLLADTAVQDYLNHPKSDPAVVRQLSQAWTLRTKLKKLSDEQEKLKNEQRELEKEARDTRLNLKAIEKNRQAADLRQQLTRRLSRNSSRQEQVTKRIIEVTMGIDEQQIRFQEAIRAIRLKPRP